MEWAQDNWGLVFAALWALSEVIGATPLKSNGVFQLLVDVLKKLKPGA